MDSKHQKWQIAYVILLLVSTAFAALTYAYQQWYVLIRMAILLPLLIFAGAKGKVNGIVTTLFAFLGTIGFGILAYLWSGYPIRQLSEAMGNSTESREMLFQIVEGVIFGLFALAFLLHRIRLLPKEFVVTLWVLTEAIILSLVYFTVIVSPQGIQIEIISYAAFFGAFLPMVMREMPQPEKT